VGANCLRSDIVIVVPALNEARTIGSVVCALAPVAQVIVVDDGSSDGTAHIAISAGATVIRHERNRGYEAAIESGFAEALRIGATHAITMDADGQHPAALVADFARAILAGADLVVGVRDRYQRYSEYAFSLIARAFFGIHDPMCGMKAYRLSDYQALGHFDSYNSVGTELMLFAMRRGAQVKEIEVTTGNRQDLPRFGSSLRANWRICRAAVLAVTRNGFAIRRVQARVKRT
jgi:glycosyltransferase involved in cell wall biosynthesis